MFGVVGPKIKTAMYTKFTLWGSHLGLPRVRTGVLGGQGWLVTEEYGIREKPGLHPG